MNQKYPPSLSKVKGWSDRELEDEQVLRALGDAIERLPCISADYDRDGAARYIYDAFSLTRLVARRKRKDGKASPAAVAEQLRHLSSGAATLASRFKSADRNTFEAWADASEDRGAAKEEWLHLKSLLATAHDRAKRAASTAEAVLKAGKQAKAPRGRPADEIATTMAIIIGGVYQTCTGKPANRSVNRVTGVVQGDFHAFLDATFKALKINSSPDASNARLQDHAASNEIAGKKPISFM